MQFDVAKTTGLVSAAALMAGAQGVEAQSFDGLYVGLSYNHMRGSAPFDMDQENYSLNGDAKLGAFVGYNMSLANGMIAGAELAFIAAMNTSETDDGSGPSDPQEYESTTLDLKAKLGTQVNAGSMPIMLYGFGGFTAQSQETDASGDYGTAFGLNYGLGAEMAVSEKFFVGLELIGRSMNGYDDEGESGARNQYGVSLRGGFRF